MKRRDKLFRNKRGQMVLIGIMVFVMVFIMAVQFIQPIKDQVVTARDSTNLDCTNASISTGQRMTCIAVDIVLPYFFATVLAAGAGYLTLKNFGQFA